MIPSIIRIKGDRLPDSPGVYLMKDAAGQVMYVGKAVSLKRRVSSYFERPHDQRKSDMIGRICEIDYIQTPTAIEALILEANLIKHFWPRFNVLEKDNKSFLYLVITREEFPKPLLVRGQDLDERARKTYKVIFGPYTNAGSLRAALEILRKIFPWSTCKPGQKRPCFYVHLRQCPGVCVNAIDRKTYGEIIRDFISFFSGHKEKIIRAYRRNMKAAAKARRFEEAASLRDKIHALEHIQDVAVIKRDHESVGVEFPVNLFGRIEGYDVSNISGTSSVASMIVFENGAPNKTEYRKFRIKTIRGANDVASLREVLTRRFRRESWRRPDLILIDGGLAQVHAAESVIRKLDLPLPVVGIAKGSERKRNDLICSAGHQELCELCAPYLDLLIRVRDEAHRFAISYHRNLRGRRSIGRG